MPYAAAQYQVKICEKTRKTQRIRSSAPIRVPVAPQAGEGGRRPGEGVAAVELSEKSRFLCDCLFCGWAAWREIVFECWRVGRAAVPQA